MVPRLPGETIEDFALADNPEFVDFAASWRVGRQTMPWRLGDAKSEQPPGFHNRSKLPIGACYLRLPIWPAAAWAKRARQRHQASQGAR